MPRRPPSKVPRGIPRGRKKKKQQGVNRAYLSPAVVHAFKRPRKA
jgi:hypothetical protein